MKTTIFPARDNHGPSKIHQVMKILLLLIFIIPFQAFSNDAYSQQTRLTIDLSITKLINVLDEIEETSEFFFVYNETLVDLNRKVNASFENQKIDKILDKLFEGTDVIYAINNTKIILRPDYLLEDSIQQNTISGTITNEVGEPLPGVTIIVEGTSNGTTTDFDGNFTLTANSGDTLIFSYIGYITQEIVVDSQESLNVKMTIDAISFEEVVVIGYGTSKKKDLTGSVVSISTDDVNKSPSSSLSAALQGRAAGVNIVQRSGTPGSEAQIRIRGANSLSAGVNDPLYVVDGMIMSSLGNNLDFNNIESVQVLKDASATAIYGSRGANGVVIITTKRGFNGNTEVGFNSYFGAQQLIKKLDFLNANDYKEFYETAKANATLDTDIDESILSSPYDTDWADEAFRLAMINNHSMYLRGGNEKATYYASLGYFDQEGILKNTEFNRLTLRLNADWNITNKLKISNNLQVVTSDNTSADGYETISNGIAWARPTLPIFKENGDYTEITEPFSRTNPIGLLNEVVNDRFTFRFVDNLTLDYEILEGLTAKVNFGVEFNTSTSGKYTSRDIYESGRIGTASKSMSKSTSFLNENTLTYQKTINDNHSINLLAGLTLQKSKSDGVRGNSSGFTVDDFAYNNLSAGEEQFNESSFTDSSLMSYLGRFNYIFKDKYFLTVSGRYDGSSRLSENNRWQFFPSAAVAWRISNEEFLKNNKTISNLKLRASWGNTGSQAVSPYSTLSTFSTTSVYLDGANPFLGYLPGAIGNANLGWENTEQLDVGLDLDLFDSRMSLTVDYYQKQTNDLLFKRDVPLSSGYGTSIQNVGSIENKGYEFSLSTRNFVGSLFSWTTNLNLSANRAKVLDLGKTPSGDEIEILAGSPNYFYLIKGETPFAPFGYVIEGLDLETNEYIFKDLNDDGNINNDDKEIIGNPEADFIFGISNNFNYKNFDFSFFLQGAIGHDRYVGAITHMTTLTAENNILKSVYDQAGTKYRFPNADLDYLGTTDLAIHDGSYVRLKEVTIGYNLSNPSIEKIGLSSLRIFLTGTNLLTFDNDYPWYDPETSAGTDLISGWDRGGYPNNKSIIAGIQIKF